MPVVLLKNQLRRAETVFGEGGGAARRVWWAASAASSGHFVSKGPSFE